MTDIISRLKLLDLFVAFLLARLMTLEYQMLETGLDLLVIG